MPFFIKGSKRKQVNGSKGSNFQKDGTKKRKVTVHDEEISSDSEGDVKLRQEYEYSSEDEVSETAQQKKLRLANKYLEEIAKEEKKRLEADEVNHDVIAARLKEDVLEQAGRLKKAVADSITGYGDPIYLRCKEHSRTITCVLLSPDNKFLISASDDFNIVKWSFPDRKKLTVIRRTDDKGHKKRINALALSSDLKFLVSGDAEAKINVWLLSDFSHVHTFKGHRTDITGLVFRKGTHELFSCSSDKTVKIWNLDEMMYVETLFGHQCGVSSIDALSRDRAVTAGGRDNTLRIWKVVEESHLVLNGQKETLDCVRLLDEDHMVSGGEDGHICLWSSLKKKPLCSLADAHGANHWIISVASCPSTDIFASGSNSGFIQVYKVEATMKSFQRLLSIKLDGNINDLAFTSDGTCLVAGVGREHKLGRWTTTPNVKNAIVVIPFITAPYK